MADIDDTERKRLLLVCEEPLPAASLARELEGEGYRVAIARGGPEAIERVSSSREGTDLVLLDVDLGAGKEGTAVAREILKILDLPIVFLSSKADAGIIEKTESIASYGYVAKDSGAALLSASIRTALRLFAAGRRPGRDEGRIRESEEKYRALVENLSDVIFEMDCRGKFTYVSPMIESQYGYKREEVIGKCFGDFLAAAAEPSVNRRFEQILSGEMESFEFQSKGEKGVARYIRVSSRMIKGGQEESAIVGIMTDITDRKLAEERLQASLQRLHDIIEFLPDPAFVIDQDRKVVAWNKAMEQLTGVEKKDILGRGDYAYAIPFYGKRRPILIDFFDMPPPEMEPMYHYIKRSGTIVYAETCIPHFNNGAGVDLWGAASPLFDSSGRRSGAIEVIRDVTERKAIEERLEQSVRDKDTMMREIQHRVKNNLSIITSLLELEKESLLDERSKSIFQSGILRIQAMAQIYEQLKMTSAIDQIDLTDYITRIVTLLAATYAIESDRIELSLRIEQEKLEMKRAVPLGLILNELVSNAMKYAYPAGVKGKLRIALNSSADTIDLIVADEGVGIPGDFRERSSPGLGLQLIEMLSHQIDGEFTIESGKGTAARVKFRR